MVFYFFFFFKQKTAYEMRISDWSSDVCSSDLDAPVAGCRRRRHRRIAVEAEERHGRGQHAGAFVLRLVQHLARGGGDDWMDLGMLRHAEIGRASCRERVCQYV